MGVDSAEFENEALFFSFADIITTSIDGVYGTDFHVGKGVVGTIEVPGDRFVVRVVVDITQMFSKSVT